jgi:hypothetical protein
MMRNVPTLLATSLHALVLRVLTFGYMKMRPPLLALWRALLRPLRGMTDCAQREVGVRGVVQDISNLPRLMADPTRIIELRESRDVRYKQPMCIGEAPHWLFLRTEGVTLPRVNVLDMRAARTCGQGGAVISADGMLLIEYSASFSGSRPAHPLLHRLWYPPVSELSGTTAVIGFPGSDNYFHWLFDVLPRLQALSQSEDVPQIDRYLIDHRTPFQRETLARLGVKTERLIQPSNTSHYRCERMVVPSLMRGISTETSEFLRDRFLTPADQALPAEKLIYVTRRGCKRRRVLNEDDVLGVLRSIGFAVVDPATMTFDEQVNLFAQARMVVAAHGGALSNLVFCKPGTVVLELFAPRYVNLCYWVIANTIGLKYAYLLGLGRSPRAGHQPLGVYDSLTVDIPTLMSLVDRIMPALDRNPSESTQENRNG